MNTSISIERIPQEDNFGLANKKILNDNRLSWSAKGLLTFLLLLPEKTKVNENEFEKYSNNSIAEIYKTFEELEKFGYCIMIGRNYIINEIPIKGKDNGNN